MKPLASSPLRTMIYASMFGALTAIGALIVIPMQPVPFTLQTFFIGVSGALLGGYAGALSQVVYVILGSIGMPVFAGGKAGLGVLFGPTGGYLIGFIIGAYVIGKLIEIRPQAGVLWTALAILIGDLVIYGCGTLQLLIVAHLIPAQAILVGVVPFVVPEVVKLLAAALLSSRLRNRLGANQEKTHD